MSIGDRKAKFADNPRPVSLLSIPGKVYAVLLPSRVSDQKWQAATSLSTYTLAEWRLDRCYDASAAVVLRVSGFGIGM